MPVLHQDNIKAAVLYAPGDVRIVRRPMPHASPGWVVLAVDAAGICGTDLAVFEGHHPANLPIVLGHEFAGRVVEIGDGVTGLSLGQPVMAAGSWPADSNQESPRRVTAPGALGRTADGCFADALVVPAKSVYPLPANLSARIAQSATSLATVVHAVDRAGRVAGMRVAIVGAGHAGLLLVQVIRLSLPTSVTVLGTRSDRLDVASSLGADEIVNIRSSSFDSWKGIPGHADFDIAFECSGKAEGLAIAMAVTRTASRVVAYGILDGPLTEVPGLPLYSKELTIIGSKGAAGRYDEALRLLAAGLVKIEPLISHTLSIEQSKNGFELLRERREHALRVVLVPDGADARTSVHDI